MSTPTVGRMLGFVGPSPRCGQPSSQGGRSRRIRGRHARSRCVDVRAAGRAGCSQEKKAAPAPSPTPIARLNTVAMQVPRIEFCTLVPKGAITRGARWQAGVRCGVRERRRGGAVRDRQGRRARDRLLVDRCGRHRGTGVGLRPPRSSPTFAETVIAAGGKTKGCRTDPGPAYGKPAATQLCRFSG